MSPEQSRAARGWLDWSQEDLARRSNVSLSTVKDFEKSRRTPIVNNLLAMRRAIESAGVWFVFDGQGKAAGIAVVGGGDLSVETSRPSEISATTQREP